MWPWAVLLLLLPCMPWREALAAEGSGFVSKVQRYSAMLERLHMYQPELPAALLARATGMQGDKTRLERALLKMIRGEPVKLALLGGSLSMRGWNHADESYMAQVHKWLELAMVEGCREEALATRGPDSSSSSKGSSKGSSSSSRDGGAAAGEDEQGEEEESEEDEGAGETERSEDDAGEAEQAKPQSKPSSSRSRGSSKGNAGAASGRSLQARARNRIQIRWGRSLQRLPFRLDPLQLDLERDLHIPTHGGYLQTHHMCQDSSIELVNLAVPAAGPGYAERCALPHLPDDVDLVVLDFGCNDYIEARYFSHPERHAFERIVRYVLSRPRAPALVAFEAFSWAHSGGDFSGSGKRGGVAQDKHTLMTEYYGDVQVLSVRAAFYQLLNASDHPQRLIFVEHDDKPPAPASDFLHVSMIGHRWYADLLINYLRSELTALLMRLLAAEALREAQGGSPSTATSTSRTRTSTKTGSRPGGESNSGDMQEGSTLASALRLLLPSSVSPDDGSADPTTTATTSVTTTDATTDTTTSVSNVQPGVVALPSGTCEVRSSRAGSSDNNDGPSAPTAPYPVHCSVAPTLPLPGLPPPFFPGNEVHPLGLCAVGQSLREIARPLPPPSAQQQQSGGGAGSGAPATEGDGEAGGEGGGGEGWEWVDEGKGRGHKWGFVSHQVGAELAISVPIDPNVFLSPSSSAAAGGRDKDRPKGAGAGAGAESKGAAARMLAWLIYLESYQGMGSAHVSCAGSCACKAFEVDAHKTAKQSVPALRSFDLYLLQDGGTDAGGSTAGGSGTGTGSTGGGTAGRSRSQGAGSNGAKASSQSTSTRQGGAAASARGVRAVEGDAGAPTTEGEAHRTKGEARGTQDEAQRTEGEAEQAKGVLGTPGPGLRLRSVPAGSESVAVGCEVRVRVQEASSSPGGGHKFKVVGLTTSPTSIWHIEEIVKTGQDPMVG